MEQKQKKFEFAVEVCGVHRNAEKLRDLIHILKRRYDPDELVELNLYASSRYGTAYMVLGFSMKKFLPEYFTYVAEQARKSNMLVIELMQLSEVDRHEVKERMLSNSDLKFEPVTDPDFAVDKIAGNKGHSVDLRNEERICHRIKVRFRSGRSFAEEYIENISKGGLFIKTEKPLPLRTELEIYMPLPDTTEEVKLNGEVVHVVKAENKPGVRLISGMGIQLRPPDSETKSRLESYIENLVKPRS
jgi:type IV pilus assembly protein PilZ